MQNLNCPRCGEFFGNPAKLDAHIEKHKEEDRKLWKEHNGTCGTLEGKNSPENIN